MVQRFRGVLTVAVVALITAAGLLYLAASGPRAIGDRALTASMAASAAPTTPPSVVTTTTVAVVPVTEPTTSTTPTVAATTSTSTVAPVVSPPATAAPTTVAVQPSPIPISVTSPTQGPDGVVTVGIDGVVAIDGQCPVVDGVVGGPVHLVLIGDTTEVIDTGITARVWRYAWPVPDGGGVQAIQAWCGNPGDQPVSYPAELQLEIAIVGVGPPPTIVPPVQLGPTLPETG